MFERYRTIHFVGIGGIGMSGIAEILHNLNYNITGSDIKESDTTKRLRQMGIQISIGHSESNITQPHVVVVSSAVSPDNPEIVAARKKLIPVIPRAEMLAELGRLKYSILVAGAHGKTTTTSLLATILAEGGLDPTIVIGGKLKAIGSNAKLGKGDFIVAEADESDGSFLKLSPTVAIITNIDREHLDYFRDIGALKKAFLEFANKVPFYGFTVVCLENEHTVEIIPQIKRKVITYGYTPKADFYPRNIKNIGRKMYFEAFRGEELLGEFIIPIPGNHNVLNSLAAIAVSLELQIPLKTVINSLENFSGIQRRFELKGQFNNIKVFDDYGHHPTEIKATLDAARQCFKQDKIIVIFQPHRYTRTKDLMDDFVESFDQVDLLYLMDIYSAGELPIEDVNSEILFHKIKKRLKDKVFYIKDSDQILRDLQRKVSKGDIVITLGAGDVYRVGEKFLKIAANDFKDIN
ncbi:MAG: UDP-N-acetylmuramate--L-alanine ligase [Thermodesulfovibrionales bacterium]|nr:UDP-N-acetylmuramate--L-alanine ligase [Thermodesulfovibrionales bacterium]